MTTQANKCFSFILVAICLFMMSPALFAGPKFISPSVLSNGKSSLSCSPAKVQVKNRMFILNKGYKSKNSKIFLITNKSNQVILVNHPEKDGHASAGWGSNLQPGNWSALLLSKKDFAITCTIVNAGNVQDLDCGNVIKVCEANAQVKNETSNYWIAEDKSFDDMVKDVKNKLKV